MWGRNMKHSLTPGTETVTAHGAMETRMLSKHGKIRNSEIQKQIKKVKETININGQVAWLINWIELNWIELNWIERIWKEDNRCSKNGNQEMEEYAVAEDSDIL